MQEIIVLHSNVHFDFVNIKVNNSLIIVGIALRKITRYPNP